MKEGKKAEILRKRRKKIAQFAIVAPLCVWTFYSLQFALFWGNFEEDINKGIGEGRG